MRYVMRFALFEGHRITPDVTWHPSKPVANVEITVEIEAVSADHAQEYAADRLERLLQEHIHPELVRLYSY